MLRRQEEDAKRLAVLLRIVHTITAAATDYQQLLGVIARETALATDACCSIRLVSDNRRQLLLVASFDPDPRWLERFHQIIGDHPIEVDHSSVVATVFRSAEAVFVSELAAAPADAFHPDVRSAMDQLDMRSLIIVPLSVLGEVIGVLAVARHAAGGRGLDQDDAAFLQAIAAHAALSISNARLYQEAQRELATRRRVESTFRISEEARLLAQAVFDTVRDPLLVLDGELRVRSANRAFYETFAADPGEVEGMPVGDLGGGQWDLPALRVLLEATARDGTPMESFELAREYPQLGRRIMVMNARRIAGAGKSDMVLLSVADVTRRVEAEGALRDYARRLEERGRELESANRELDSFSYSVSHDLRAPLRAIDGFSRILGQDYAEALDPEATRLLGIIRTNTRRMGQLIDDLLAFSRLGRQAMALVDIDMEGLVRAVGEEIVRAEPERRIELRIGALPIAQGDRTLIEQVWVNLLANAVKYTRGRDPAVITVDGAAEADQVVFRIADNGVGFDMRYANKLFGVFQRLHASSDFEGTGVGLALVRRIVVRHGGWITAEGRPDSGASFELALPRRDT